MASKLSEVLGKHLFLTMVVCDRTGEVVKRRQVYGTIEQAGNQPMLRPEDGGETIPLPPTYDQYERPDPDQFFTLQGSSQQVGDVDYVLTFVKSPS